MSITIFKRIPSLVLIIWALQNCIATKESNCSDYLHKISDYTCEKEDLQNHKIIGSYFLLSKNQKNYALVGRKKTPDNVRVFENLKMLQDADIVLRTYESFEANGNILVVTDLPKNGSLRECAENGKFRNGSIGVDNFMLKLAVGVQGLHELGWVATDLTLDTIWIDEDSNPVLVDVTYFVPNGAIIYPRGNQQFMAPEILDDFSQGVFFRYDPDVDIYSIGVVYYYLMKNKFPMFEHLQNFASLKLKLILFDIGDFEHFADIIFHTVNINKHRYKNSDLISELRKYVVKPADKKLTEERFYTFEMDHIHKVEYWHKYLFFAGVALVALFFVMFVVFLIRCFCKGTFLLLCCPFLRKKKEPKRLEPLHITNGQGLVIIKD